MPVQHTYTIGNPYWLEYSSETFQRSSVPRGGGGGEGGKGMGEFLRTLLRGVGALASSHVVAA